MSQRETFFEIRPKGQTDTFWVIMSVVPDWNKADSIAAPGESRIVGKRSGYSAAFTLSDEMILMGMKGDLEAIQSMLREGRCRIVIRGNPVVVLDQENDFVKVRRKGTTNTVWLFGCLKIVLGIRM
jgi:hypothetical protein